jgi:hypothetical protein
MFRKTAGLRAAALLLLVALAVSGCSLFNQNTGGAGTGSGTTAGQGAVLGQIVTAEQIDPKTNAPLNTTNTFNSQQPVIYAVVQAQRIEPGTSMFARWSRDGKPFEDSDPVKANQLYENRYVEFHLQSTRQQIDPGNYTVQVFVDGNPAQQTSFTVQ